jgi:hypothetical protein
VWIQRAMTGVFGLGDGCEQDALKASQSPDPRQQKRPSGVVEVPLYGEAAAIRVLYQAAFLDTSPPKPPRPSGRGGLWVRRYLSTLSSSLRNVPRATT